MPVALHIAKTLDLPYCWWKNAIRNISRDEKAYADDKGVSLIEHPIGRDAFIFIVNNNNPVTGLTISQIQDIYTGKINNWNEVNGNYGYARADND